MGEGFGGVKELEHKAQAKPPSCVVERVNQSEVAGCRLLVNSKSLGSSSLESLARVRFVRVDREAVGFGA